MSDVAKNSDNHPNMNPGPEAAEIAGRLVQEIDIPAIAQWTRSAAEVSKKCAVVRERLGAVIGMGNANEFSDESMFVAAKAVLSSTKDAPWHLVYMGSGAVGLGVAAMVNAANDGPPLTTTGMAIAALGVLSGGVGTGVAQSRKLGKLRDGYLQLGIALEKHEKATGLAVSTLVVKVPELSALDCKAILPEVAGLVAPAEASPPALDVGLTQ